jgi:hypothetical protein
MRPRHAQVAVCAALALWSAPAHAQKDFCGAVREQLMTAGEVQEPQQFHEQQPSKRALSGDVLFGSSGTIGCLVELLQAPGISMTSPDTDPIQREWLLRITGAMRSILATRGTSAIRDFRAADDLATTTVLAYAARSADAGLRVNATLVLADVIDDSTVCVPIDHLYDPDLLTPEGGTSGRINLIGVVSVVAPWAFRPTYENIRRLAAKLEADLDGKTDVRQASEVLANLKARLDFQQTSQKAPNMLSDLPSDLRACTAYQPLWAGPSLVYEAR